MAAATATYRIGPSDVFTGGDLAADADTLNTQVTDLDGQVEGNEQIDQAALDQWTLWLGTWKKFYTDEFGGFFRNLFTALNDSNRDQLIQFETTFGNFAQQFSTAGAAVAGGVVAPSTGSKDTIGDQLKNQNLPKGLLPSGLTVEIVIGLLIVLVFLWKEG
jgi:hypothetical protein